MSIPASLNPHVLISHALCWSFLLWPICGFKGYRQWQIYDTTFTTLFSFSEVEDINHGWILFLFQLMIRFQEKERRRILIRSILRNWNHIGSYLGSPKAIFSIILPQGKPVRVSTCQRASSKDFQRRNGINQLILKEISANPKMSLSTTKSTQEGNQTYVLNVAEASIGALHSSSIRESTRAKNPISVLTVQKASVRAQRSFSTRECTEERNLISVLTVVKVSFVNQDLQSIRGSTRARSLMDAVTVGKVSGRSPN